MTSLATFRSCSRELKLSTLDIQADRRLVRQRLLDDLFLGRCGLLLIGLRVLVFLLPRLKHHLSTLTRRDVVEGLLPAQGLAAIS